MTATLAVGSVTVGSVGVPITVNAGGYSLTGSTCTLWIAPGQPPRSGTAVSVGPMTVSSDGLSATYVTTGTDFVSAGWWTIWLSVTNGSLKPGLSPPGELFVNAGPS